jgi:hypothetical protein
MGTAGKQFTMTIPIEPGDTQADVVIRLPLGCPVPEKARVAVKREGQADVVGDVEVHEVAA